jgi:glycogen debranching enzyme
MDVRVDDWVVTPRHGFAVEVNALWGNALHVLATLETQLGDPSEGRALQRRAAVVKESFGQVFWNERLGCLYDVVGETGGDPTIRPNQIFALSLPLPLIVGDRARSVLDTVERKLLTPVGLRSLAPDHPDHRPTYGGDPRSRDGAYHQGTVWGWLLGPYLTALLRFGGDGAAREAREIWTRAVEHLNESCVGSYSEIFDSQAPHRPHGAFAQAWSVAELLRVRAEIDEHLGAGS